MVVPETEAKFTPVEVENGTEEVTRIVAADGGRIERALSTTTPDNPPYVPMVMAFPVPRRPMFPGTMQAITINRPWVVESLQQLVGNGVTYIGVFYENEDAAAVQLSMGARRREHV
eukprot:SAG31_NODE_7660_length_1626_cov_0.819908_1_plen_115_part_10